MVTIRLARRGGKKRPFYHLTVAEKLAKRDGRFIERVGFYNPVARGKEEELRIDLTRVDYWLSRGAIPTERVDSLVKHWRKQQTALAEAAPAEATPVEAAPAEADPAEAVPAEAVPAEQSTAEVA